MCGYDKPQHADLLTPEQWQAVLKGNVAGDPVLEEASSLERRNEEDLPASSPKAQDLPWPQARTIILLGAVQLISQSHSLNVVLFARSGKIYRTHEPNIDEAFHVASIVDACHLYIRRVTE
jgi:hypothetical protein